MDIQQAVIDRLVSSPLGQKLIAEQAAETHKQRAALAAEATTAQAELEKAAPALNEAVTDAEKRVSVVRDALRAAEHQVQVARGERHTTVYRLERRRDMAHAKLMGMTPEAVKEFARWTRDAHDLARKWTYTGEGQALQPRPLIVFREEAEAQARATRAEQKANDEHRAYLQALLEAPKQAQALCLQPLGDADIIARVGAMRAELQTKGARYGVR